MTVVQRFDEWFVSIGDRFTVIGPFPSNREAWQWVDRNDVDRIDVVHDRVKSAVSQW